MLYVVQRASDIQNSKNQIGKGSFRLLHFNVPVRLRFRDCVYLLIRICILDIAKLFDWNVDNNYFAGMLS